MLDALLVVPFMLAATFQRGAAKPYLSPIKGPAVIVLLKDGCPCTRECRFQLNALADAFRGKVHFEGIVDGNWARAASLAKEAELRFPVLPDPKGLLIRVLRGREGLDMRFLAGDGRIVGGWDALDRANVAALAESVRTRTGIDVALSLEPFTILPKIGCAFNP